MSDDPWEGAFACGGENVSALNRMLPARGVTRNAVKHLSTPQLLDFDSV